MKKLLITLSLLLATAGCASGPRAAPGTNPGDMSAAGHRKAAAGEEEEAAMHERRAKDSAKITEAKHHEKEAAAHEDVAGQHEKAAEEAE